MASWSDYNKSRSNDTSIATSLSNQRKEQISRSRHYVKTFLEVLLCATQENALRGHREVTSKNKGKFLTILGLVGKHDSIVASHLSDGSRNASYTSHNIQNELLQILAKEVQKVICDQVSMLVTTAQKQRPC